MTETGESFLYEAIQNIDGTYRLGRRLRSDGTLKPEFCSHEHATKADAERCAFFAARQTEGPTTGT